MQQGRRLVIIESPYKGGPIWTTEYNVAYARRALLDSLERGEAPFASHLLYTQVWDDDIPDLRTAGIEAGLSWGRSADLTAVYCDHRISTGMMYGIERAMSEGRLVEYRWLECLKCETALPKGGMEYEDGWTRTRYTYQHLVIPAWLCSGCSTL